MNEQNAPRTRPLLGDSRRDEIAERLRLRGALTVAELEAEFGVSSMTARRDLTELARQGRAKRTHGGAVLPAIAAHEDSFASRLALAVEAKQALGRAAAQRTSDGESVFLDSSSTAFHVARALLARGVHATVLTHSLPVMELVSAHPAPSVELIGIGGTFKRLTCSYVGPFAVQTVAGHFADRLFFSVKGVAEDGRLTDADPLEAEVKRTMLAQAGRATLLVDASKLGVRGLSVIGAVRDLASVLTVAGDGEGVLAPLRAPGVELDVLPPPYEGAE